jgi:hypothetical protein
MELRDDIYLNVMHPAMFALQEGVAVVSVSTTFFLPFYSNLLILTRLNVSAVIRSSSDHHLLQ